MTRSFLFLNLACIALFCEKEGVAFETLNQEIKEELNAHPSDLHRLQKLIEEGADPNTVTTNEWTALQEAVSRDDLELAQLALEKGANVNSLTTWTARSPLINAAFRQNPAMLSFLISRGASLDLVDKSGKSALWVAAMKNDRDSVKILLSYGAQHLGSSPISVEGIDLIEEVKEELAELKRKRKFTLESEIGQGVPMEVQPVPHELIHMIEEYVSN